MNKKDKIEMMAKIMEAVLKSPALGNLPGNRDEIIENIKVVFNESIKHLAEATRGIKD